MTLRFLQAVDSAVPGFPFLAGQVISLPRLTPEMQRWVRDGRAVLVKETEPELATVGVAERAVVRKGKR